MIKYKEITVGISKKIGQPDFGSIGLSAGVTMECEEIEVDKAYKIAYKRCWDEIENQEKELDFIKDMKEVASDFGPEENLNKPPESTGPVCKIHNLPFKWVPAGISKTTGKPYPGFYSCSGKNQDGSYCKEKP